ncbi:MAG: prepilin-type N-terminal cleavage/methylation domain-containing protein [Lachnospiraceae bacterium]|nr:prepilin-type N-terminal cleavage/methylation domain-containing protein [Lachnospiraceae bacterium]
MGKWRRKLNNAGTTLVEVLAAFVVLALILGILYHVVDFSDRLRMQAVDSAHLNQMFLQEIYKNEDKIDGDFVKLTHYGRDMEGYTDAGFWLVLDTERTDLEKNYKDKYRTGTEDILNDPPYFYLENLSAAGYLCVDPLIEEEKLPRPEAMIFHYRRPSEEEED